MPDTSAARLDTLYRTEIGSRWEVPGRYVLILISIGTLVAATGQWVLFNWLALYTVADMIYMAVLFFPTRRPALRLGLAIACQNLAALAYILAALRMVSDENASIVISGAFALVAMQLYYARRPQVDPLLDWSALFHLVVSVVGVIALAMPRLTTWLDVAAAVLAGVGTVLYFMMTARVQSRKEKALRDAQRRYTQSQKARALGQFVGGVAHDFNNQLAAIIGHLELHDLLDDPRERAAALRQSRDAAHRAAMTVRQLLASSGRTRLAPQSIDLGDFLDSFEPLVADLREDGIHIDIQRPKTPMPTLVDPDMLETCVLQLFLNAQDAVRDTGIVRFSTCIVQDMPDLDPPPEHQPPLMALVVEDTGGGVSDEALSKLAEPFYTTKAVGEGAGLGLSAVAGFARQSGGALHLGHGENGLRVQILLPPGPRAEIPGRR